MLNGQSTTFDNTSSFQKVSIRLIPAVGGISQYLAGDLEEPGRKLPALVFGKLLVDFRVRAGRKIPFCKAPQIKLLLAL